MTKTKWPEKVTNEEVFERIGEKRTFPNNTISYKEMSIEVVIL
jgi:hypothetical protein